MLLLDGLLEPGLADPGLGPVTDSLLLAGVSTSSVGALVSFWSDSFVRNLPLVFRRFAISPFSCTCFPSFDTAGESFTFDPAEDSSEVTVFFSFRSPSFVCLILQNDRRRWIVTPQKRIMSDFIHLRWNVDVTFWLIFFDRFRFRRVGNTTRIFF